MVRHLYLNRNIACMIVISLIANMSGSMILPLFAIYVEQFGISTLGMSILFSLFYVGRFLGGGMAGRIYEKIGAKRLGLSLLIAEIACMLLFPIATSFIILSILRLLQGLVAIGLTVFVRVTINHMSTAENRGTLNGYISSSEGAGMILGPLMSGAIVSYFSLSIPFYFVAIFSCISFVAVSRMTFLSSPLKPQEQHSPPLKPKGKTMLTKPLLVYSTVHFLEMSAFAIFLTYFSVYATYKLHWSPAEISLAFTIIGISTFISAPFIGKISDLLKDRLMLCIIGLLLIMVEIILFLWFTEPWIVYLAMFIGGIGGASYLDSFYSQLGDVIPEENRSSFIGNVVSLSELGAIVSPIIAGALMERFSINTPFYYNLILVLIAIVIQYVIRFKSKSIRKRPIA
ncbi:MULTISPECIES: MFS transporter [Paenibacillus]|uniref:Permease n=1 Tax=Paenibacillus polymyxa TaxID=1406 RepID=A0ABX2ZHY3_PAEPO|nr:MULTISPECIES: MFS transporter [Paenibacillus]APB78039.1 MFS transporter [Paenibacillus polymyxa]MXO76719.1 MFS transporter [Paenibacillus sp. OT2-17]ODA11394.1 permease [Paenibacillus polymyxa]OME68263.1 MFS transporter [Paenibacillus peoriae]POR26883.1 MFS transporter [Paenibacillus polymyxa]